MSIIVSLLDSSSSDTFNCYKHQALLLVWDPGKAGFVLFSKEGCTQGDPFAMVMYAVGTLPMIRCLHTLHLNLHQPWYADDAGAMGCFDNIHSMFESLKVIGTNYGYLPNASKCILVVPDSRLDAADLYFNKVHDHNFQIKSGARYLGGFVGSESARDEFISKKIEG